MVAGLELPNRLASPEEQIQLDGQATQNLAKAVQMFKADVLKDYPNQYIPIFPGPIIQCCLVLV